MKALIAVDGTERSKSVLSLFKTMAREPESVILVHVQRSDKQSTIDSPGAQEFMNFYGKELEGAGRVKVTTLVRDGIPSEEILRAAREEGVDFIILGSSGKSGLYRAAAGRVAAAVERNATVPVLIARTNRSKKFIDLDWRGKEYAA